MNGSNWTPKRGLFRAPAFALGRLGGAPTQASVTQIAARLIERLQG